MGDISHLLLGGVALSGIAATIVATFWSYFRLAASRASGLLVLKTNLEGFAATSAYTYLRKHAKFAHPVSRKIRGRFAYDKVKKTMLLVGFEGVSEAPALYWLGWRPLLLIAKCGSESPSAPQGSLTPADSSDDFKLTITYLRGSLDLKQFVADALAFGGRDLETLSRGFEVHTITGTRGEMSNGRDHATGGAFRNGRFSQRVDEAFTHSAEEVVFDVTSSPGVDEMSLNESLRDAVLEARRWFKSRSWYNQRNIPWRRGWLFTGNPGTGKTAYARAIAKDLNIPVFLLDLGSFTNRDLISAWQQIREYAPCMVVMEDIDGVFHGRDSVLPGGMTFDALLNCINGVNSPDGVFLVVTTNKPELLDEALSTARPGRIDRALHFGEPTNEALRKMALRIVGRETLPPFSLCIKSFAQAQEYYTRLALEEHWNPPKQLSLDEQAIHDLVQASEELGIKV